MTIMNIVIKYKYFILFFILFFILLNQSFTPILFKEGFTTTNENILYGQNTYNPNIFNTSNSNINTKLINEYSHTVNLPLNNSQGCQNACYNAKCSKTGSQCSTDVDCYQDGCQSLLKQAQDQIINEQMKPLTPQNYVPVDNLATGRLIYNQNPQHSSLTYDIGTNAEIINKDAQVPRPYAGVAIWQPAFNAKAQLIDDALAYQYAAAPEEYRSTPVYKKTVTATGLFYDIGPTAANADNSALNSTF